MMDHLKSQQPQDGMWTRMFHLLAQAGQASQPFEGSELLIETYHDNDESYHSVFEQEIPNK
ncbi:hypothetical protein ACFODT_12460 [Vibrio zhugei]|uniref:Uncharacterized protein n=1 Tax=Vibrio zhugei TaxID=2479546 RepID=A0ABV7CDI3_9VIBR|nr:hypothetical protein [Vibrio zhugei]